MARIFTFLWLMLIASTAFSQNVTCIFQVKKADGNSAAYIELLVKPAVGTAISCKTDSKGKASTSLPNNTKVKVEAGGEVVADFMLLPKQTGIKTVSIVLPTTVSIADLSLGKDTFKNETVAAGTAELTLKVFDFASYPLADYEVFLTDAQTKRSYKGRTNSSGDVVFHVPPGKTYQPVIDGFDGLPKVQIRDYAGIKMTKGFAYEPTVVDEMRTGDTIVQNLKPTTKATTARVLIDVTVADLQGQPLANEAVYVYQVQGNLVYAAQTNGSGKARLLIPKGFEYYIGFKYADRIDLLNYKEKTPGEHTSVIEYSYRGSAAIEAFYSTAKRNKQGFLTDFESVAVSNFKEDLSPFIKKRAYGYDVEFPEKSIIPGPLLHKAGVITSDGYWTSRIYCLNETTGQMKWGVQLAENGPSPFVESEDVLLINTESCTIYAIDVLAGNLLWSKWLSPYLYCTPTIANGKVYTVYGNDLGDGHTSNTSVLACFDLKTGAIEWQQWMPNEIIGAPVFANNKLYLSCWNGTLMQVDAASGIIDQSLNVNAISPATVAGNALFVATKSKVGFELKQFNTSMLKSVPFSAPLVLESYKNPSAGAEVSMTAATARPSILGTTVFVADDASIIAFDIATGKQIWKKGVTQNNNGLTVCSNGVLVHSPQAVEVLNSKSGVVSSSIPIQKQGVGAPVLGHGYMALPDSTGGLMVMKLPVGFCAPTTKWTWGGNAAHNAVLE